MWVEMGELVGAGISEYLSFMQAAEVARVKKMKMIQQRRLNISGKAKE